MSKQPCSTCCDWACTSLCCCLLEGSQSHGCNHCCSALLQRSTVTSPCICPALLACYFHATFHGCNFSVHQLQAGTQGKARGGSCSVSGVRASLRASMTGSLQSEPIKQINFN